MRVRLLAAVVAGVVVAVGLFGSAAWAHVEVSADKPRAGASNVTVTFTGEAESTTAGIRAEQVFLPAGITPAQVRLGSAPPGWSLTRGPDNVSVAGPALATGTDVTFSLVIAALPTGVSELVFKTIETYGDGEVVRWIDLSQPGQAEPEHPAPTLKLAAAGGASTTTAPATTGPATTAPDPTTPTAAATGPGAAAPAAKGGVSVWLVAMVIVVLAGTGFIALRRRRS